MCKRVATAVGTSLSIHRSVSGGREEIPAYGSLFAREERLSEMSLKISPYGAMAQNRYIRHSGSTNCPKNFFL